MTPIRLLECDQNNLVLLQSSLYIEKNIHKKNFTSSRPDCVPIREVQTNSEFAGITIESCF